MAKEIVKDYVVVKFVRDYADEFNTYGIIVCEKTQWEVLKERVPTDWSGIIKKHEKYGYNEEEHEEYFGTNEAHTYSSYEDYFRNMDVTEVSKEGAKGLRKLFVGEKGFGGFKFYDRTDPEHPIPDPISFEWGIVPNFDFDGEEG